MFCENCGKQTTDGAAFCEHCGAKIETAPVAPAAPAATAAPVEAAAPAKKFTFAGLIEKAKAIHQKNKLIFPIIGAVLVVAIALAIVFGILGKQVSMKDYMDITMEGYDGYGYMDYEFGDVSFGLRAAGDTDCKEFGDGDDDETFLGYDKTDVSKKYRDKLRDAQKLVASLEISYELPEGKVNGKLSNGDVIKFTIEVDEELAEELGLTIKDATFEYTVEGLKPLAKFDILSYFDLAGDGYDGYGTVSLKCNQTVTKQVGNISFEMEAGESRVRWVDKNGDIGTIWVSIDGKYYEMSNGDKVKAYVEASSDRFIEYGVDLINIEKEYTVAGLKEIINIDLLEYYTVEFKGVDGSGSATVVPKQETITVGEYTVNLVTGEWYKGESYVYYTYAYLSKNWGLTNGDEIELYLSDTNLSSLGVKVTNESKKVTVATLGSYVMELSDIKDDTAYQEAAKKAVVAYLERSWSIAVHDSWYGTYTDQAVSSVELYKMVLATNHSAYYDFNDLWMVYKVVVSDNEITTPTAYYIAVAQDNVYVNADGTLMLDSESFGTYSGRTSYEKLYSDTIQYVSAYMSIETSN